MRLCVRSLTLAVLLCVLCQVETELSESVIERAVRSAKAAVDSAYESSRRQTLERVRRNAGSPGDIIKMLKEPKGRTREATRCAEYFNAAVNNLYKINLSSSRRRRRALSNQTAELTPDELQILADKSGCTMVNVAPKCKNLPYVDQYRTADSTCNNKDHPLWGASNIAFKRWLKAEYQDGVRLPKGWESSEPVNGALLPLVRNVSNHILATGNNVDSDNLYSMLVTFFSQWMDHDLTLTPHTAFTCHSCEQSLPCFPIKAPLSDSQLSAGDCLPFVRSAPACTRENLLEQLNALTAYVDVGQVYGSDHAKARALRDLTSPKGLMKVNEDYSDVNGRELLPFSEMSVNMCATKARITGKTVDKEIPCFDAGDERSNENIALTSLHTLFLREHNRIARKLALLNPHWDGDKLYQEARKILGAMSQIITMRDYLSLIVGPEAMSDHLSVYPGYNSSADASIVNVFATAAYRFAHLMVQPTLFRLDEHYEEHPQYPSPLLHRALFTPWRVIHEGGIDPIVRGIIGRQAKLNRQDKMMPDELRLRLFTFNEKIAMDLASLNMQRGRDHGLPGYNSWRRFCGLSEPQDVYDLALVLNNTDLAVQLLAQYKTPKNIDPWLGGVAEPFVTGGRVGPLFACLISKQFRLIQEGDRFWWEKEGVFSMKQRSALHDTSMSRIICDNTDITVVPRQPFRWSPGSSGRVHCSEIPEMDLWAWKEIEEHENQGPPGPPGPRGPPGPSVPFPKVAFSARLGNNYPKEHQPIVFHQALVNRPGHYCADTGVFTCVVPGVYEFHMTLLIYNANVGVDLMCNRDIVLHTFNTKSNGYISSSGSTLLSLRRGDRVYLLISGGSNSLLKDSMWTGNLLFTEEDEHAQQLFDTL